MSRLKKNLLGVTVLCVVGAGVFFYWLSGQYVVPIMMYHNVNYTQEARANTVSPENFERHMAYLKTHGFQVISFNDFVSRINAGGPIPKKSVVITFDDGYEDNYQYAFKILKKYGFPAIVFLPSDFVNTRGYMTWEQIKEMRESGITIGSHTRRHIYLPDLPMEEMREEIKGSKSILERQLGVTVDYFAYPIGGFSEQIKQMVREAGYKAAAATNRGYDRFNRDVFELKRIRFSDKDNRSDYLWMKLSGYYNLFREAKRPH